MKKNNSFLISLSVMFLLISCTSSDSKFLGTWKTTNTDEERTFTVTKYGESFVFDGERFNGTFTKTKEGNLFLEYAFGYKITVLYDDKTNHLIWSTRDETIYCRKVKEPETK